MLEIKDARFKRLLDGFSAGDLHINCYHGNIELFAVFCCDRVSNVFVWIVEFGITAQIVELSLLHQMS